LGKINQERLRRTSEETANSPMQWGPFWDEWKQTHPLDGEAVEGMGTQSMEDTLNGLTAY
jgi:hypothetical protein